MLRTAAVFATALCYASGCSGRQSAELCLSNLNFTAPFVNVLVTDATTNLALCGATVSLSGAAPTTLLQAVSAKGDASCFYEIELGPEAGGPEAGAYTINVSAPGYQSASKNVAVTRASCGECCSLSELVVNDAGPVNDGVIWEYVLPLQPQ